MLNIPKRLLTKDSQKLKSDFYSVNSTYMGPPYHPIKSGNPLAVKVPSQNVKNKTDTAKKSMLAIFAMSTIIVADIQELVHTAKIRPTTNIVFLLYHDCQRKSELMNLKIKIIKKIRR